MVITAYLDLLSLFALILAGSLILFRRKYVLDRFSKILLILLISLAIGHDLGNLLSSLRLSPWLERHEDYFLILEVGLWGFLFYNAAQQLTERKIRRSEERLRLTLEGTQVGIWEWHPQTGEVTFDQRWADIIGYRLEELEPTSIQDWETFVHPEDWEEAIPFLEKHFSGEQDYYEFEVRMRHRAGHWVWALNKGRVVEWDHEGKPLRVLGTHQEITDRKLAEMAQEQHIEQQATLLKTGLRIASELDLDELIRIIVVNAVDLVNGKAGAFNRLNPEQGVLDLDVQIGYDSVPENTTLGKGEGLIGAVWAQGQPIRVDNYLAWEGNHPDWVKHFEENAVIGVPVQWGEEFFGVLEILRESENPFSDEQVQLLELFAHQAAVAIHNAQLYESSQTRLQRLNILQDIEQTILSSFDLQVTMDILISSLLQTMQVDAAAVLLFRKDTQQLEFITGDGFRTDALRHTRLRLGEGQAGKAALERKIIHIPDLSIVTTSLDRVKNIRLEGFVSYLAVPLVGKGELIGVLEVFHRAALDPAPEWLSFLETLAGQAANAIDNLNLYRVQELSIQNLTRSRTEILKAWALSLEHQSIEPTGHTQRVVDLSLALARKIGLGGKKLNALRNGALLHDIGMISIPSTILRKRGPLSEEEWEVVKKHPIAAQSIVAGIEYLRPAMEVVLHHHERWDGTGYPFGLKEKEIPLPARIFSVVDVWDSTQSDRPDRIAWSERKALSHLKDQAGKQFDPRVTSVFLEMIQS